MDTISVIFLFLLFMFILYFAMIKNGKELILMEARLEMESKKSLQDRLALSLRRATVPDLGEALIEKVDDEEEKESVTPIPRRHRRVTFASIAEVEDFVSRIPTITELEDYTFDMAETNQLCLHPPSKNHLSIFQIDKWTEDKPHARPRCDTM